MNGKDLVIFAVVACVSAAVVFGGFVMYRIGSLVVDVSSMRSDFRGDGETRVARGELLHCLGDRAQYGWYHPERCVEKLGWSVEDFDDRRPEGQRDESVDPRVLPAEFWVREEVHLARLETASSFRPDQEARNEAAADLVRLAKEIEEAGYLAPRIEEGLFNAGAYEEVLAVMEHLQENRLRLAARAAVRVGTREGLGKLKGAPMAAEEGQVAVIAGLCLAGEMEEAKERIRFLLDHRQEIRGRGLPLESLTLACGIEPGEVGIEEIAATSMDWAEVHALLLALNEDREATKTLVERLERSGEGSFLPALARYIVQQEPALEEVLENLGYSRESRGMTLAVAGHSCAAMGSEMQAPLAAGGILEAGAQGLLELEVETEAEEEGSYFLRVRERVEPRGVRTRRVDVDKSGARKDAAEMLFLEAARHYLHVGMREEAREILASRDWRRDGSREACLAQLWMELGELEEMEKVLEGVDVERHPHGEHLRDLLLRAALLRGDVEEGREIFSRQWEELARLVEAGEDRGTWRYGFDNRAWPWMAYGLLQSEEEFSVLREALPAEMDDLSFWLMAHGAIQMLALPEEELRRERSKREWRWSSSMASTWAMNLSIGHLAGPDDVEVWLDGFEDRQSLGRGNGWRKMVHRREAALLRGDEEAAAKWEERLESLLAMAESPERVWLLNQL